MKKHLCLIFAILLLLVVFFGITPGTASAEKKDSEAYFVLKNGQFQSTEEIIGIVFQNSVDLVVDYDKVSSQLVENFNHDNCVGTSSYKFDGSRDTGNGNIKGTFVITIKGTCPTITAKPFSFKLDGTVDGFAIFTRDQNKSSGTAKGHITNTTTTVTFVVDGVVTPMSSEIGSIIINFPEIEIEGYVSDSGARFSGITGQIEWRADNDPDGWKFCKFDTVLPIGAHIKTGEDSIAILSFPDMTTFVMKPETEIVIASPPEKDSKIKLVAGNIWMNIKKMVKDGSMEIEMNQAVCGIKGTTFILSDDGKTSTLQVIEGEVSFTSKSNGKQVDVVGGSMVSASSAGLGNVEPFDTAKVTVDWDAISNGTQKITANSNKETGSVNFKSNGFLVLYGLIGVIAIFVIIIIIRKIKR